MMELKVWVDGVQRVVCGISEQTTVQEVVIALAQATGRTGRYTLVEKWRSMEKMLPPSEHPLQVLSKWGDKSNEVQFLLRRTGASSVSGMPIEDGVVTPERSGYRQSLPPQLKHRQKNDGLLNRKEPMRKSLSITGNENTKGIHYDDMKKSKDVEIISNFDNIKREIAKNNFKQKNPIMPPSVRKEGTLPRTTNSRPPSRNEISKTKKDTLTFKNTPPSSPKKAQKYQGDQSENKQLYRSKTPVNQRTTREVPTLTRRSETPKVEIPIRALDVVSVKARQEFTRLVMEQHGHIKEQTQTFNALSDELEKYNDTVQRKEKNSSNLAKEIESLEKKIRENNAEIYNEKLLEDLLVEEDKKVDQLKAERSNLQSQIESVNNNLTDIQRHISFLNEEIQQEQKLQNEKSHLEISNRKELDNINSHMEQANRKINLVKDEISLVEADTVTADNDISNKKLKLESLNRELRQVNLQQFIRKTGSKVTVLPPEREKSRISIPPSIEKRSMATYEPLKDTSGGNPETGGVWV